MPKSKPSAPPLAPQPSAHEKHDWATEVPPEYGHWADWNSWVALNEEFTMASRFRIPWRLRGPPGPGRGGPTSWRNMKFRFSSRVWMGRAGNKAW